MLAPCDVHILLRGDHEDREVEYCPDCDANLCAECRDSLTVRGVAAIKRLAQNALAAMGLMPGRS